MLNKVAQAILDHGFEVQLRGDALRVHHGFVLLDSVTILEAFGDSCIIESEEDGIRYGVDRVYGRIECEQWLGVLNDRRDMADDGQIIVEMEEVER